MILLLFKITMANIGRQTTECLTQNKQEDNDVIVVQKSPWPMIGRQTADCVCGDENEKDSNIIAEGASENLQRLSEKSLNGYCVSGFDPGEQLTGPKNEKLKISELNENRQGRCEWMWMGVDEGG